MNSDLTISQIRNLSKILSNSEFKEILYNHNNNSFSSKINKYGAFFPNRSNIKNKEVIIELYDLLKKNYRNEYVFKNTLINKLLLGKYSLETTTAFSEFKIGKAIADLILINGNTQIFEIKTELDNYERLNRQIEEYQKAVGIINVVVFHSDKTEILDYLNNTNIGVVEITKSFKIRSIRKPTADYSQFDHVSLFKLLRKHEYLTLVHDYFDYLPEAPNTLIFNECLSLVKTINIREFHRLVFITIKKRRLKCSQKLSDVNTISELKQICLSSDFSDRDYEILYSFLDSGFN